MAEYAGVTFNIVAGEDGTEPQWEQESVYSSTPIPYANKAVVQYGGKLNPTLVLRGNVTTDADWNALRAAADGTRRVLTDAPVGTTTANVLLKRIRHLWGPSFNQQHDFEAEFEQVT